MEHILKSKLDCDSTTAASGNTEKGLGLWSKKESTANLGNKGTKTLYRGYLHRIANFCAIVFKYLRKRNHFLKHQMPKTNFEVHKTLQSRRAIE